MSKSLLGKVIDEVTTKRNTSYTDKELSQLDGIVYLLNYYFSLFPDTIYLANEANKHTLSGVAARDFYKQLVPKRKRFAKWPKRNTDLVEIYARHFECSTDRAKTMLLLTDKEFFDEVVSEYENRKKS